MKTSFAFLFSVAVVADVCVEDDTMSALQSPSQLVTRHEQQSCTSVVVGQVAPINGMFTAADGSKVDYRARRGEVARSAGRFCVDEPTVSLLQRAFSVSDVSEFDVLLRKKSANSTAATGTTEGSIMGKEATRIARRKGGWSKMDVVLGPYPGYSGILNVTGVVNLTSSAAMIDRANVRLRWSMQGLEGEGCAGAPPAGVANACGIHIHEGKTCENTSAIQGHYYDHDYLTQDPWSIVSYLTIPDQGDLRGDFSASTHRLSRWPRGNIPFDNTLVFIGTTFRSIEGRALVVHDSTGDRVACGLIYDVDTNVTQYRP